MSAPGRSGRDRPRPARGTARPVAPAPPLTPVPSVGHRVPPCTLPFLAVATNMTDAIIRPPLNGERQADRVTYTVKEMFLTAQGEGANIGRTAVFIRFAGCNLWSGREQDRASAICRFCDTDFVGGSRYAGADELADAAAALWPASPHRMAVLTGGEPLLQADAALIVALQGPRLLRRGRNQRHAAIARTPRLGVRQSEGRRTADAIAGGRTEAGLSAGRSRA